MINPVETKALLENVFPVHCFEGGSHRFEHMSEALEIVNVTEYVFMMGYSQQQRQVLSDD